MSRKYDGIGLGLAISKRIVENLGGSLSFESEEGKGAVFRLEVPLEIVEQTMVRESKESEVLGNEEKGRLDEARLLIVDDHSENRSLMADIVRRQGWSFAQAANGSEAIQMFKEREFSVILMDVRMPGVNGIEATQAIRGMGERGRGIPIIAMTAHDNVALCEECFSVGMNDFILKPIRIRETVEVITKWLRN